MPKPPAAAPVRVLIVDDHLGVRTALQALLSRCADLEVVGVAESGEEAISLASLRKPHVVLMDVEMPGIGGIEATRQLTQLQPTLRIIGHSSHDVIEAMRAAGAADFVQKGDPSERLLKAIRAS